MRVFCAVHTHLALLAVVRRHPELRGEPVIVGGAPELRLPVIAASAAAVRSGVRPGMPLRQAQQLCPAAAFVSADAGAVADVRATVETALADLSPAVEVGDDEVLCDCSGRHARHADESSWAAALARALHAVLDTDPPAAGVAGSRFVARIAARRSDPSRIRRVRDREEAAFLAPLPLEVLPVAPWITARLAALGLDCLGAVAAISPADLQRQFGTEGLRLARLVRGDDGDAGVQATPPVRTCAERLVLDGAVGDLEQLMLAARHCATAVGVRLAGAGLAAASVRLTFEVEEGAPLTVAAPAPMPVDGREAAWTAVLGLLGELHPAAPVTAVGVEMRDLTPAGGRQADMWRAGDAARDAVLATAVRLRARFGETAVRRARLAVDPGDLPERRFLWEAPLVAAGR